MIEILTLGLSIPLPILAYILGRKKTFSYRKSAIFQYAMMIAKTASEEWVKSDNGFRHSELGNLYSYISPYSDKLDKWYLGEEEIDKNMYNELRHTILENKCLLKMRKRTKRLKGEMMDAVDKMNDKNNK